MRFSIVTPVMNGMPWLQDCVDSVHSQMADVDLEHLVLDAGSTDGSRDWLLDHSDYGFKAILEPDEGQTDALIRGFERATGDVFGWLNADDTLEPGALATVQDAFEANREAVMVTGACLVTDAARRVIGALETPPDPTLRGLLWYPPNLAQPATFFRADAYRRAGGLDRRFDLAMDVDLWLRLAANGIICVLPNKVLARYMVHPAAKSVARSAAAAREDLRAKRRHGSALQSPAVLRLIRIGYLRPVLRRPKRALVRLALLLVGRR